MVLPILQLRLWCFGLGLVMGLRLTAESDMEGSIRKASFHSRDRLWGLESHAHKKLPENHKCLLSQISDTCSLVDVVPFVVASVASLHLQRIAVIFLFLVFCKSTCPPPKKYLVLRYGSIYIYMWCHASSGTTFLHFRKLMCGTRLRIAKLQFLGWPHFPPLLKIQKKEAPERTTPKVNEWPHFWPVFPSLNAVHSLTLLRSTR